MTVRSVLRLGDPRLRQVAEPVEIFCVISNPRYPEAPPIPETVLIPTHHPA